MVTFTMNRQLRPAQSGEAKQVGILIRYKDECQFFRLDKNIPPECFDSPTGLVTAGDNGMPAEEAAQLNNQLARVEKKLTERIHLLEADGKPFGLADVCDGIAFSGSRCKPQDVYCFFRLECALKAAADRHATRQLYEAVLHSLKEFHGEEGLPFPFMNASFVARYGRYLAGKGLAQGSVVKYLTVLRTICLRAARKGAKVNAEKLFGRVNLHPAPTRKRAIDKKLIRRIARADLRNDPALEYARDLFLFSFFAQGMSFVDMLRLRKSNIRKKVLTYRRAKCGTEISVGVTPQLEELMAKYAEEGTDTYLFPTLRGMQNDPKAAYKAYRLALFHTNRALCKISERLKLEPKLTTYTARHSWATNAQTHHVPLNMIRQALGHSSIRTTEIYLKQFDWETITKVNARITKL